MINTNCDALFDRLLKEGPFERVDAEAIGTEESLVHRRRGTTVSIYRVPDHATVEDRQCSPVFERSALTGPARLGDGSHVQLFPLHRH